MLSSNRRSVMMGRGLSGPGRGGQIARSQAGACPNPKSQSKGRRPGAPGFRITNPRPARAPTCLPRSSSDRQIRPLLRPAGRMRLAHVVSARGMRFLRTRTARKEKNPHRSSVGLRSMRGNRAPGTGAHPPRQLQKNIFNGETSGVDVPFT